MENNEGMIRLDLKPFNDVEIYNCYFRALIPIIEYYGQSYDYYFTNPIIYTYSDEIKGVSLLVDPINHFNKTHLYEQYGIRGRAVRCDENNVIEKIKNSIRHHKPLILPIDDCYLPIYAANFHKEHHSHCILVYGYNEATDEFAIMDKTYIGRNLYEEFYLKSQDVAECFKGFLNYFNRCNFYTEYEPVPEYRDHSNYQEIYLDNLRNYREKMYWGLDQFSKFIDDHKEQIYDKEFMNIYDFELHNRFMLILTHKKVDLYSFNKLVRGHETFKNDLNEIVKKWEIVRCAYTKFFVSKKYNLDLFLRSIDRLNDIYHLELNAYDKLYKNI